MKDINFEIKIPHIKFSYHRKFQIKLILSCLIVAGVFWLKQNFDYTFVGTLVLIYFGFSVVWNLTIRISASLALFFLASCPILLISKNDDLAETFAVYAYYFLVITVFQEIILLIKDKRNKEAENNQC